MSRFLTNPEPRGQFVGPEEFRNDDEISFQIGYQLPIVVPAGTVSEFASIPRFFQRILPKLDIHRPAAIIHDYLYQRTGKLPDGRNFDRKQCDEVFLEAMTVLGVPTWKRQAMYWAVRLFGFVPWRNHEKRNRQIFEQALDELAHPK